MISIELINIDRLTPYRKNIKAHGDHDVEEIAKSIRKYGMNDPIGVWGKKNLIVEGHGRAMACKKLGLDVVPCIRLDHLSDKERREYAIVHNKSQELAPYDLENLEEELADLELDEFDFDFSADFEIDPEEEKESEYEQKKREFEERMAAGENMEEDEEYKAFVEKFEPKKTTDDCYTPPLVYDAVAEYVEKRYGVENDRFVRPFYPGGDYQKHEYKSRDVVVDNPPFSIFSEIVDFYQKNGIKFFLFGPALTLMGSARKCAALLCGVNVVYENGAVVLTSFATNMESCAFRSCPDLYEAVKAAVDETRKEAATVFPRYQYPKSLVSSASVQIFSKYGIEFSVDPDECYFVRKLDSQDDSTVFGGGYLISDKKKAEREKAEREKAEREKAEVFTLSERELAIIGGLK